MIVYQVFVRDSAGDQWPITSEVYTTRELADEKINKIREEGFFEDAFKVFMFVKFPDGVDSHPPGV